MNRELSVRAIISTVRDEMKILRIVLVIGLSALLLADASQSTKPTSSLSEALKRAPSTEWAHSVIAGKDDSFFSSVAVDRNVTGNVYAAGSVLGPDRYQFGPGVIVTPTASKSVVWFSNSQPPREPPAQTAALVMFDRDGSAQWAAWPTSGSSADSVFSSAVPDYSGNVFVSGGIGGRGSYDYGNGVTVTGSSEHEWSAVLVKYDRAGKAKWARSISGPSGSFLRSVAVDTSQNVYAVGDCEGTGVFDFGAGVSVTGKASSPAPEFGQFSNPVLVKYDPNGKTLWARTVETSSQLGADFNGLAIDAGGAVYVTGMLRDDGVYDFGNGVNLVAASTGGLLLAKYNSDGEALWAKTNQVPADHKRSAISILHAVAVGPQSGVVVVGFAMAYQRGNVVLDFGQGVSATLEGPQNALIASYDADGTPLWARTTTSPASAGDWATSQYTSVVAAPGGQFYVGGSISVTRPAEFNLGDDVKVALNPLQDAILVDYTADGKVLWAKSAISGGFSGYSAVSTDWAGSIFGLGSITGTDAYNFGNGVSVAGTADVAMGGAMHLSNFLLTKYRIDQFIGQQLPQKYYENDVDGIIETKGGQISIDVLDNPHNGKSLNYSIAVDQGMRYLLVNQQRYLVLVSDEFIYLLDSDKRQLFNGIAASGRALDFLIPATTYKASSFLKEKGIEYSASNLSYLTADKPWAVRAKNSGIGQTIEMSWDVEIGALVMINGFISYSKPALFGDNNRVKRIRVTAGESKSEEFELQDSPDPQLLFLKNGTKRMTLTILDVYRGSKWDDTCINMVQGFESQGIGNLKQRQ